MVNKLSPEDVYDMLLSEDDVVVVDVLPREYFRKQHLPKAINIPLDEFEEIGLKTLEKDRTIVLYCYDTSCQASPKAAKLLKEHGYTNVFDLEVGIEGYKEAGFTVKTFTA